MKEQHKLYQELIEENTSLKQRVQDLEQSAAGRRPVEERTSQLGKIMQELNIILENAPIGISKIIDRKQVLVNRKIEDLFQYTKSEMEFQTTRKLYPSDGAYEKFGHEAYPVLAQGLVFETVEELIRKDGAHIHVRYIGKAIEPADMSKGTIWLLEDVTERKEAEKKLIYIMKAVESAADAIGISDSQRHHIYQNKAFTDLFGYRTAEELEAAGGGPAVVKDPALAKEMFDTITRGKSWAGELQMAAKSGRVFPAFERADAIKDQEGNLIGLIGIITDITERKRAEEALQKSESEARRLAQENELIAEIGRIIGSTLDIEEVYERFAEKVGEAISFDRIVVNTINMQEYTRTMRYVNGDLAPGQSLGEVFPLAGTRTEQVVLTKSSLLINSHNSEEMVRKFPKMLLQFDVQSTMLVPLLSNDAVIGVLVFHSGRVDAHSHDDLLLAERVGSQIAGAIANAQLFLARRQAEVALKIFKESVENSSDAIGLSTPTGHHYYQNQAFDQLFGPIGETPAATVFVDREIGAEVFRTIMSGGQWAGEVRMYAKDRRILNILLHAYPNKDEQGNITALVGIHTDITERKRAEENIRQSESFIRGILDTVDEGFIAIDRDYRILTANKAYRNQYAGNGDDVIGRHCYEVSHKVSRPCFDQGEACAVREVFATGNPQASLHKHPGQDGQVVYVETKAFPIKDQAGNVTSVIETINNITEKHLLEEERLKTQKLESIGTLAGGIAHDFNNLLQGIFGYISMAKMTFDQKEKSLAMLEQAEKALHQSVNLTTQLLTFSKGGKPVKKPISLKAVIENAVRLALSGSRSDTSMEIDPALWNVNGDAGQLGQVIQNIVLNADQAMPLGGVVKISARNMAGSDTALPSTLVKGNYVQLVIEDKGMGIPEQYLDKIFDPYFTTKEKGSGLGLATSYSIIRNHDGQIKITSEVSKGTVFYIYIPSLADSSFTETLESAAPFVAPKVRVLVMDDEELIRDLVTEQLRELGHEVDVAAHGEATLAKYKEAAVAGHPFDIVILDLTIRGGMGGLETIQKLIEIAPDVKAVVSSGYSADASIASYRECGFQAFLKKPYNISELRALLYSLRPV